MSNLKENELNMNSSLNKSQKSQFFYADRRIMLPNMDFSRTEKSRNVHNEYFIVSASRTRKIHSRNTITVSIKQKDQ